MGRALRTAASLGWTPHEGWWCWDVPGQEHPLHFVQEPLLQHQHRVRDSLRCHSARQMEARRLVTFRGAGRWGGWPGLPRGAAGSLHGVGEVAAARAPSRSHVDGGPGFGPRHTRQRRVPALRRGARGRGPRPVGLLGVGRRQRDVAPLAPRRGGGHPWPRPARPVALLLAKGGTFPAPAGAGSGPGPPRRISVRLVLHVLGRPRGPNGGRHGGLAGPRRLPLSRAAAPAAPHLRWPHTGGRRPPPAAAAAGGAARLEVAPGLHPRPGQVGPGAGRGSMAGGGLLGRAGPGL